VSVGNKVPASRERPPASRERRRHVRVQPTLELPATVMPTSNQIGLVLQVLDISLGGVGLWVQRGSIEGGAGAILRLSLELAGTTLDVEAVVRHVSGDGTIYGTEFGELTAEARSAVNRYVTELTERGGG
jgi:c-di-GMP-binding flagellar brake protein YcgR